MGKRSEVTTRLEVAERYFIGIDLASRTSTYCVLDEGAQVRARGTVGTTRSEFEAEFGRFVPARVAIEAGCVSRMADEVLGSMGHRVVVANPRRVAAISQNVRKCDEVDAELLARLVRSDPSLLSPVEHRSAMAHVGLAMLKARDVSVRSRTAHVNLIRGLAKAMEIGLPPCDADQFEQTAGPVVAKSPFGAELAPTVHQIGGLTRTIAKFDRMIDAYAAKHVPRARELDRIPGVGPITAVAFALAVDDPRRFPNLRAVGAYFGLVPRRDQSGEVDKKLGITKAGDPLVRRLLTQCAHTLLQANAKDSGLKRYGTRMLDKTGTNRKRVVSAVARRLAVQMLRVLRTGEPYDPNHQATRGGKMPD